MTDDDWDVLADLDEQNDGRTIWGMWDNDFEEERRYLDDLLADSDMDDDLIADQSYEDAVGGGVGTGEVAGEVGSVSASEVVSDVGSVSKTPDETNHSSD